MAIVLNDTSIREQIIKSGNGEIIIPAQQWLNVRHGTPQDPETDLEEQVPIGKQWRVRVYISIEETDA